MNANPRKPRRAYLRAPRSSSSAAAAASRRAEPSSQFPSNREQKKRFPVAAPPLEPSLWATVLAGGDGTRLRSLVERIHSDGRPKQFAAVLGTRTLLRETLDRIGILIPPERTVVVGRRVHEHYLDDELAEFGKATVLLQPDNRGTAAGILLPVHWIERIDPHAVVAVFPSDHFILGSNAFMAHICQTVAFVNSHPDVFLLVGAPPARPEPDLGWVEPGMAVGATASGPICRVARFREKPAPDDARAYFQRGFLWNTFVMVGRASAIVAAGKDCAPDLSAGVENVLRASVGGPDAFDRAFTSLPEADFSRTILEKSAGRLVISRLPDRIWSDWGTPERVFESLTEARVPVPARLFGLDAGLIPAPMVS